MKNKKNILSLFILGVIMMVFVAPLFSFAQVKTPPETGVKTPPAPKSDPIKMKIIIDNPFKQDTIQGLIETIVNDILLPIGGVVAVLMIMYAGFMYVTAQGDPGQIKKAHDALLWAVIGAAILLGAWVISEAITATIKQLKT